MRPPSILKRGDPKVKSETFFGRVFVANPSAARSAMSASTRLSLGLVILFVGIIELLMLVEPRSTFVRVALQENGPVETAQFVGYILLAVFAFQAGHRDLRPAFPVCWRVVGVFAILGAGEESDWGRLTRQIPSVRQGRFSLNMMNVHNTLEDFLADQPWLSLGVGLMLAGVVLVLFLFLIRPLMQSGQLQQLFARSSGWLAAVGVGLFLCSQFFDVGLFPATTRANPYVDFWDEGLELAAVTCFVMAALEERRWMEKARNEG